MARRAHSALVSIALYVQLTCVTRAYAASPYCLFSQSGNSEAENVLQGMTLETCMDNGGDVSICQEHGGSEKLVRHYCRCGNANLLRDNNLDCGDFTECCKTKDVVCLNGGNLGTCNQDGYFECDCVFPFHGRRCELLDVNLNCSIYTPTDDRSSLLSCKNVAEPQIDCLHSVNQNRFRCSSPVSSDVSDLPNCSKIPEGDEGSRGLWSAWSQWSICSMTDDAGPCMCRSRECEDGICEGTSVQVSNCTEHGYWTDWTPWSACSATRGRMGERTRHRFCSNPAPKYGGRPCDGTDIQRERCTHDCPVSGSELQMTEFSSWANMTFTEGVPGWLRVRTKLVCQAPGGELEGIEAEVVADACYLLKVSVEHCHTDRCIPLRGLRKLIENSSTSERNEAVVEPDN